MNRMMDRHPNWSKRAKLFNSLRRVRSLRFVAHGERPTGWNGVGLGTVAIAEPAERVLTFSESGQWLPEIGQQTRFTNVFRWTIISAECIRLEHLRFGPNRPVLLFEMVPSSSGVCCSVTPHVCQEDCYSAELRQQEWGLTLDWTISGATKSERIEYRYLCAGKRAK